MLHVQCMRQRKVNKLHLFEHQQNALNRTKGKNRVAYYHDMGLGKTFTGSEKMKELGANVNLIICQKSKINDWYEHFKEHYDVTVLILTHKVSFQCFIEWSTNWIEFEKPLIAIINYELAWRRKELLKLNDFTLMLDESSLIQNDTAKQSNFILKLQPANVILLSGTPTSGKYENLWSQAKLLGWDISKKLYNHQYINWTNLNLKDGSKIKVVDENNPYKNVERLKRKFREYGGDFIKTEDVINLPDQTYVNVNVDKSKEYVEFKKNSIIKIGDNELIGNTALTKMLYLRQLCGQYSKAKLEAFKNLLESTNERLIVFYNFNQELYELRKIAESLNKPISFVNGSECKDLTNYENWSDSVTFVQYQAGSRGLNLQKANKIIYFTLPLSSELFEQSKKRIHRIGQKNNCIYYIMQCKGTIEEKIYKVLQMRRDYTLELFKGGM